MAVPPVRSVVRDAVILSWLCVSSVCCATSSLVGRPRSTSTSLCTTRFVAVGIEWTRGVAAAMVVARWVTRGQTHVVRAEQWAVQPVCRGLEPARQPRARGLGWPAAALVESRACACRPGGGKGVWGWGSLLKLRCRDVRHRARCHALVARRHAGNEAQDHEGRLDQTHALNHFVAARMW